MRAEQSRKDPLGGVPVFSALSRDLRDGLVAKAERVQVPAGEWLFRQGDPGDSLYVVLSGRVEVVLEEPEPAVLRVLGRGSALGELALLTQSERSASARARRDSELLQLKREDFDDLLADQPHFTLALARVLGEQLQESRALSVEPPPVAATIAVLPLVEGLAAAKLAAGIAAELERWHGVAALREGDAGEDEGSFGPALDRLERDHDQVVLAAERPPGDPWTEFTLRQADRVVALTSGPLPAGFEAPAALRGCDVLHLGSKAARDELSDWIVAVDARSARQVPNTREIDAAIPSLARRLAARSLGLVLSGGGARGFAHIGVLEELGAAGITIDRVAGCSMGSFIGAQFAMGLSPDEIRANCEREFIEGNPVNDYTLPLVSLVRGVHARDMLLRVFGEAQIEELERSFFCVSADLISAELAVHRRGSVFETVGASMCLPGIGPPVPLDDSLLVDGGVFNNLPVEPMATSGEGPVIAADVTGRFQLPERRRTRGLLSGLRDRVLGLGQDVPVGFKEIMIRTVVLGSIDTAEAARQYADLLIEPDVQPIGMLAFDQLEEARDAGRRAAHAALEAAPEFVAEYG